MAAHEALRQARLRRHWTQEQLAIQLNTTRITVNRWERGTGTPGPYFRRLLFELFGEDFFHESEPETGRGAEEENGKPVRGSTIWAVPLARNLFFTGREATLRHLARSFRSTGDAALAQVQVISALGGMGKTQTALEYAYRFQDNYTAVIWLRAETRESLFADAASLVTTLNLPEQQEHNTRQILHVVQRWLAKHTNWLVIFDNVEDLAVVRELLPAQFVGHVLVTTQSQATGTLVHRLDLQPLPLDEGCLFVLRRAKLLSMQANLEETGEKVKGQAEEICQILGGLPLALDQAGAYLEETSCTLADYLQRLHTRQLPLLARRGQESTMYPAPVTATILLALERVEQMAPAALEILRFCAFLAADAIPEELLTTSGVQTRGFLHAAVRDGFGLDEAFAALSTTSLLTRNGHTRLLTMHRVVQTVICEQLDQRERLHFIRGNQEGLAQFLPTGDPAVAVETWPQYEQCFPHLLMLENHSQQQEQDREWVLLRATLLLRMGIYLQARGRFHEAEDLLATCVRLRQQVHSPDHGEVAAALYALGELASHTGAYAKAEALVRRALEIQERLLGPENLTVADILHRFALIVRGQGRYEEARTLSHRALQIREQVLGPQHLSVAGTLNNLGLLANELGHDAEAQSLYQRALAIYEHSVGSQHPRTAVVLINLGRLALSWGRYQEAESLLLQGLEIFEQAHGKQHPSIAFPLNDLGRLHTALGNYEQAYTLLHRALDVSEQALGLQHDYCADILNLLGELHLAWGTFEEACAFLQQALEINEQALGPHHPHTAGVLYNLGELHLAQGEYKKAEPCYQRALQIWEQAVGSLHPNVARVLQGLTQLRIAQGRYEEAEDLARRALQIHEQAAYENHPDQAESLHVLARLYRQQGRYPEAEPLYLLALTIYEQTKGHTHPTTQALREEYRSLQGGRPL